MPDDTLSLGELLRRLSTAMSAEAAPIRLIRHPSEHGRQVESALLSILRRHLPERFALGTGFVIGAGGVVSPQCDIVIYDRLDCPRLFASSGGFDYYPVDGVLGVIEATDKPLTPAKMREDLSKLEAVRALPRARPMPPHFQDPGPVAMLVALRHQTKPSRLFREFHTRRRALIQDGRSTHCANAVVLLDYGLICYGSPDGTKRIGIDPAVMEETGPPGSSPQRWRTVLMKCAADEADPDAEDIRAATGEAPGNDTLAYLLLLLLNRLCIQREAMGLARSTEVAVGRQGADASLAYRAAADGQLAVPPIGAYFDTWLYGRIVDDAGADDDMLTSEHLRHTRTRAKSGRRSVQTRRQGRRAMRPQ